MSEEEYLMHMAVADRLREARAAAAGRATLGSRAASSATGKDTNMNVTKGLVVPAGGGKYLDMTTPGRFATLKLPRPRDQ